MSKKKILLGIALITFAFSTLFITLLPNIYSNNKSGKFQKEIEMDFSFLEKQNSPYLLLYFGYIDCHNICPIALNELNESYEKLNKDKFTFLFINLKEDVIDKSSVDRYAKIFNKDFKGIHLNNNEIKDIINKLSIKYLPSIFNKDEIEHSSFLYVLKKQDNKYMQKFIYTARPFNKELIIKDLQNL